MDETIRNFKEALEKHLGVEFSVHIVQQNEKKDLKKELPISGDEEGIPKDNAWIVWLKDKENRIIDLQVYEMDRNLPYRCEKTQKYVENFLGKTPYYDIGCVNHDWDEWRIEDVLFKFGIQYGFKDRETTIKCMKRLATIKEFEQKIKKWLKYL